MLTMLLWPLLYIIGYFFLYFTVPLFFEQKAAPVTVRSWYSIAIITIGIYLVFFIALSLLGGEIGNRFQHSVGGGALAFYLFYRVIVDGKVTITKLQFFTLGFLIVIALGVANELLEFALQAANLHISATTVTDTWLDLLSNTVGASVMGAILLLSFFPHDQKRSGEEN